MVSFCETRVSKMALNNFQKHGFDMAMIFLSFCFRPGERIAKKKETKKKATTRSLLLGLHIYSAFYGEAFVLLIVFSL